MADTQDLYLEELASEDQARYRWQGGWEQGRVLPLEFHVKGRREPLRETCLVTRHGPDIAPALDMEGPPLVLHSTVLELPTPLASALQLLKARSWEEFRRLLEGWTHPCLNFIYADVRGNIGYQLAGRIPHRGEGQGLAPLSGWSGQHQWRGYIPFEELPSLFNPPSHYVASANDRMVGDDYPYALGLDWADDFRVRRIRRVLEGKRRHSLADFQGLQMDQYSLVAEQLTPWLLKVARQEQDLPEAARLLEGWDSRLSSETAAAALFQVFVSHLQHALFQPQLGPLTEHYLGKGVHPILPANSYAWRSASKLLAIVQEGGPPWLKGPAFEQQARRSLREAWVWLEQHLGPDPSTWRWGDLHQLSLRHIFGSVRALAPLFNIGPFPLGGDTNTVNAASFATWSGYEVTGFTPSLRYVVDLGDPARSVSVIPGGQGGHPLSRHYADQMSLWLQGRYHPMLLNREALGQHIEARLLLKPAKA
jgi:penicillin amidase